MNKKGFISMTLIYSFLIVFLFLITAIIAAHSEKNNYIAFINEQVDIDLKPIKTKANTLYNRIMEDNTVTNGNVYPINKIANDTAGNGKGVYYLENVDENGDNVTGRIYYYRGNVDNNFVRIVSNPTVGADTPGGGYCFRIIRTNEDSTIRMVYYGPASGERCTSNTAPGNQKYGYSNNDNAYVGYMIGKPEIYFGRQFRNIVAPNTPVTGNKGTREVPNPRHDRYQDTHNYYETDLVKDNDGIYKYFIYPNDKDASGNYIDENTKIANTYASVNQSTSKVLQGSFIKRSVDNWYIDNLFTSYSSIMADSVFCNNRKPTTTGDTIGVSNVRTDYVSMSRINTANILGLLKCEQEQDRFSLSEYAGGYNTQFNSLKYPVGIPTVADILLAGGSTTGDNTGYYMYFGNNYWTMTPAKFDSGAYVYYVSNTGKILYNLTSTSMNIRPVVSLKNDVIVQKGNGKQNTPYVIEVQKQFTLNFDCDGGNEKYEPIKFNPKSNYVLNNEKCTHNDEAGYRYTFLGWYNATDSSKTIISRGTNISAVYTNPPGGTLTLKAKWEKTAIPAS